MWRRGVKERAEGSPRRCAARRRPAASAKARLRTAGAHCSHALPEHPATSVPPSRILLHPGQCCGPTAAAAARRCSLPSPQRVPAAATRAGARQQTLRCLAQAQRGSVQHRRCLAPQRRRSEPACGDASVGAPARPYPAERLLSIARRRASPAPVSLARCPQESCAGLPHAALVESTPRAGAEHSCIILHHSSVVTSRCSSPTPQVQCRRARTSAGARWPGATASGIAAAR